MPLQPYDPQRIQKDQAAFWEREGFFHCRPNPAKRPYSIVMPPPNVTGALHLGHALNGTLQDVMTRFKRMQGFEALWMPGADHAGIATQAVVEKRLFEEEKKTRHDIGRDALVKRIWAWKDEYEARIIRQLKAMGSSCDWSRWRFTLDDICARAVRQAFFNMFKDGLIFRGKRLVNWDVQLQTAVADDEVYHDDVQGNLWHFKYPVEGMADTFLEIATTRPETMLGDTAVAVHPDDPRYKPLHGKSVRLPLMDRLIPIITDGQLVDMAFGTGVVKVTPAHDPNDYACGQRHRLEMINIMAPDGKINANGGKYQGLPREKARKAVVADMETLGLVAKVEPHRHAVGHSDRSKTAIEPYLSDQWFVKMDTLAEKAMAAVRGGRVKIHPPRYADTYLAWLGEKRDWCISRQLWWGHQIPIWSKKIEAASDNAVSTAARLCKESPGRAVLREEEGDERFIRVCLLDDEADLVGELESAGFVRDPDVLDTWFSSGLWPISTMGWPEKTEELEYFYPTSLLSTAREIITLWVARMVIMGEYNAHDVPFRDVFIHPVIQDGNGMPMKKSLGNGVDPFDIIDKYGADAMRYTLVSMTTETQDVRMPVKKEKLPDGREVNTSEKFEIGRNFGTKIYNASKFLLSNMEGYEAGPIDVESLALEDKWILGRLSRTTRAVTDSLEKFEFAAVGRLLYEFVWNELCDWHIEITKPRFRDAATRPLAQRVAALVLDRTLRLLHPIMPFLTEEVWQALGEIAPSRGAATPHFAGKAACVAEWPAPAPDWEDDRVEVKMDLLREVVRAVRNVRAQFGLSPRAELDALVDCDPAAATFLQENEPAIKTLASVRQLAARPGLSRPDKSAAHVLPGCKIYVPLAEHIDVAAEIAKQQKKKAEIEGRRKGLAAKLDNTGFVSKAPPEVVAQHQSLLADLDRQLADLDLILADLAG